MPRTRFNVRFFAILCLLAVLLGTGFYFLHKYQIGHQANSSLDRAHEHREQANTTTEPTERLELVMKAVREYRTYLRANPENVDVLFEQAKFLTDQGKWVWKNGDPADAGKLFGWGRGLFEQALRQDESRTDIREEFIDTLVELGGHSIAMQHIRLLCDFPENQQDLQKLFDHYKLWERAIAAEKVKVGPNDKRDLLPLLKEDRKTVDHDALLEFLGDDFWVLLDDPQLLNTLGRCQLLSNNPKPASKAIEKSLTLAPDNLEAYDMLINALRLQKRDKDVERWMQEVVKANPDQFLAYLIRGRNCLNRARSVSIAEAEKVLASSEWDGMQAVQRAVQQLLELAEKLIPNAEVTKALNQDFKAVANLSPAAGEKITDSYREALLKAVAHVAPAAKLMEETLAKQEESTQSSGTDDEASFATLLEKDRLGCRDGLFLAIECKRSQSRLDKENSESELDAARELAKATLELFPEDHKVYLALADIELQAQKPQKMIEWMTLGAKNAKENTWLRWRLGTALAHTGKIEEARAILEQLKASNAKKMIVLHLEAALDMRDKNWSAAAAKLEEVRPSFVSSPSELRKIDILLADCYGKLGRLKDQREAYARAAHVDRTWMPALVGLAKSRAATGQLEEAIKDYKIIFQFPDVTPERRLEYAQLLLQATIKKPKGQRDFKEVEEAINQAEKAAPGTFFVPLLRAEVLVAKGKISEARQLLTTLHDNIDKAKEAMLQKRTELLEEAKSLSGAAREEKLQQAKFLQAKAKSYDAQKPQIWAKIVALASQQGDWQAADKVFQQAEANLGDSPTLRLLQAQKLLQTSDKGLKEIAKSLHPLAENTDNFDRTERLRLLRGLASLALRLNDMPQAERLAKEVLLAEPSDVQMQKILFQVARSRKDLGKMQATLDRIRKSEDTASAFWHYGEAIRLYMLAEKNQKPESIQDAMELLSTASRMEPLWHEPTLLLAQIFESQGKKVEASDLYLEAIRNGMRNPEIIQRVAGLLTQQRRYQEADEMFDLLTQMRGTEEASEVDLSASYVKAQLGDLNQSVRMARKACLDSKNYQDFLWLGRVLGVSAKRAEEENKKNESQKLYTEAEQAFRKATELNPEAAGAWIGLVHFYALFDKKEQASQIVTQAKDAIPKKDVDLALAQAYETLGEVKKAAMHYRKAIRNAPRDANVARTATLFFLKNNFAAESKSLLKRIADKQVDASPSQVAWAKRTLGMLVLSENGSADNTQAIALIDENLKANPNSALDLYTKASLLADDPTGLRRDEAIALLEKISSQNRNPGLVVQLKLADLYYLDGRWGDYRDSMRDILSKAGDQPQIVGKYVARLADRGESSEASVWLDRLQQLAPDATKTFLIGCDVTFGQEQYDALLNKLNNWVNAVNDSNKEKKLQRLSIAAAISQKYAMRLRDDKKELLSKRFEVQAEDFMKKLVAIDPGGEASLAVLYSQQGQYNKAVVILHKLVDKASPNQFGKFVYRTLSSGDLPERQIVEIQKLLKQVNEAHPDDVFVKMMLAFCEEKLGQPRQAETILRKALQEHPDNVDIMNYLAVSLALHGSNLNEAYQLIQKAIKIAGSKPDLLDSRAMILLAQGRSKEALTDLRQAIIGKPSAASFYFHLADALQQQGLKKQAKEALEKANRSGFRKVGLSPSERRNYQRLKLSLEE